MEFGFWSIITFILCTALFWVARRRIELMLDEQGIDPSPTRTILIFSLAIFITLAAGKILDWTGNLFSPEPQTQKQLNK